MKEVREKKEKNKSRQRFWEMAGSKMGDITGLTEDERKVEEERRAGEESDEGERGWMGVCSQYIWVVGGGGSGGGDMGGSGGGSEGSVGRNEDGVIAM